jgi:hypothetical protein
MIDTVEAMLAHGGSQPSKRRARQRAVQLKLDLVRKQAFFGERFGAALPGERFGRKGKIH